MGLARMLLARLLFDDSLNQVSWPIDVDASANRQRVGEQLKGNNLQDGSQKIIACWDEEAGIAVARDFAVALGCECDDPRSLLSHVFHELKHLRIT